MKNHWVCKFDGTIQCDPESHEITLEEMREQLALIIGEDNILGMEKRSRIMIQLCGMPTGRMNAYQITAQGEFLLAHGTVGRQGFEPCEEAAAHTLADEGGKDAEVNIGQLIGTLTSGNPIFIRELVGRHVRVYHTGDGLTLDWRPERANIELSDTNTIVRVWFG